MQAHDALGKIMELLDANDWTEVKTTKEGDKITCTNRPDYGKVWRLTVRNVEFFYK